MDTIDIVIKKRDGESVKLSVKVAVTTLQLQQGLMHVKKLDEFDGMLFDFGKSIFAEMWTKDTSISLDMLFFDSCHKLVCIHENTMPYDETRLGCDKPVAYVLAIASGQVKALGITIGDVSEYYSGMTQNESRKSDNSHIKARYMENPDTNTESGQNLWPLFWHCVMPQLDHVLYAKSVFNIVLSTKK